MFINLSESLADALLFLAAYFYLELCCHYVDSFVFTYFFLFMIAVAA